MARTWLLWLAVAVLWLPGSVRAQPPDGVPAARGEPEYKMLFWFDRRDPLNTLRYRAYDLRRGQYTAAVDEWVRLVKSRYPEFMAFVRDVDLEALAGSNDAEKLQALVRDQYERLIVVMTPEDRLPLLSVPGGAIPERPTRPAPAAFGVGGGPAVGYSAGYTPPGVTPGGFGPRAPVPGTSFPPIGAADGGLDRSYLAPPPYPFPVPVPYPRPHP